MQLTKEVKTFSDLSHRNKKFLAGLQDVTDATDANSLIKLLDSMFFEYMRKALDEHEKQAILKDIGTLNALKEFIVSTFENFKDYRDNDLKGIEIDPIYN